MNYKQIIQWKQRVSKSILLQLNNHAREVYGAIKTARQFIMESPNPAAWLTASNMRRDVVELLRLYMKPETFDMVAKLSKQHHSTWMTVRKDLDVNIQEIVECFMYMEKKASPQQQSDFIIAELMTGFLELEDISPRPVQALIKGTIFEAITNQNFTEYRNYLDRGTSVNTTLAPIEDTCLMFAIRYQRLTALKWIMRDQPNMQRMNRRGETALTLAIRVGLDEIAQEFRDKGVFE